MIKAFLTLMLLSGQLSEIVTALPATDGRDLGIMVMGSIVGKDHQKNVALIKIFTTGKVQAVKNGFMLKNQFIVTEITAEYIQIQDTRNKKAIIIYQEKYATAFAIKKKRPKVKPKEAASIDYKEEGFQRSKEAITMTNKFRQSLLNDLPSILMQATATPIFNDGNLQGFKLHQIDANSIFDKAGFQNGDEIVAINGGSFKNIPQSIKTLNSLKKENEVEIEIIRGGTFITKTVKVK